VSRKRCRIAVPPLGNVLVGFILKGQLSSNDYCARKYFSKAKIVGGRGI